jgi:hypothetical protein
MRRRQSVGAIEEIVPAGQIIHDLEAGAIDGRKGARSDRGTSVGGLRGCG